MNIMNPTPSTSYALASRAMIVSLKISQWSGRRLDRQITDKINQEHNAAADAGRYNKLLLPKEALDPIVKIVSQTRNEFLARTLPWMDNGSRIMAAEAYMAHMSWLNKQMSAFNREVDDFIRQYPDYVNDARNRLQSMFKSDDYPSFEDLRSRFGMDCKVLPVPTSDDFRVDMSDAQAQRIREDIEKQVSEATNTAVQDIYRRIADATGRMVERLNAYKPKQQAGARSEGVFRDSLVENIRDLINVLPALNITGDPALSEMADKLKPLAAHDAAVLRDNETIRKDVASEAQAIFDSVSDFLA